MATVSVTDSNNRRDSAESVGTVWTKLGTSGSLEAVIDYVYQGTYGITCQVSSETAGLEADIASTVDMTAAADNTVIIKALVSTAGLVGDTTGVQIRIGSSSSDYYSYMIADGGGRGDIDYPPTTSWLLAPINPNIAAWRDGEGGTPALGSVDYFGWNVEISSAVKGQNVTADAIDISPGLYLVGGTSTDPDGTWQDFVDDDEGTSTNRFGHIATIGSTMYCAGTFAIGQTSAGTSTETDFTDANRVVIFRGGRVDAGWNRIYLDCATANTTIQHTDCTVKGEGRDDRTNWFSTIGDVDATNNEVDITDHGYSTGDMVTYTDEGGSDSIGLTDVTDYFVRAVSDDAIAFYAVGSSAGRANSYSDTSRVSLSAGSNGENHKLVRKPYTQPDITTTGTASGATEDWTGCTFDGIKEITLTTASTHTNCKYLNVGGITPAGGTITGGTFQDSVLDEGEALISCTGAHVEDIENCTFTSEGRGHAFEITDATGSPFDFTGHTFTNYGQNRTQFDTENDVDGTNEDITINGHGWSDGDHVYYNDEGGTETIGLTDGNKYYVNSIDTNTISLHLSKTDATSDARRVGLTASTTGNGETHSLYSGTAAVYNSSGSAITLSVLGTGVSAPTVRNSPGSTTTADVSVSLTINVEDEDGNAVYLAQCAIYKQSDDTELMNEDTTTAGVATQPFVYPGSEVAIYIRVRKGSSGATKYIPYYATGSIDANGFTTTVRLIEDSINSS